MSFNLAMPQMIDCNGDGRWPCRAFFDAGACVSSVREARRYARKAGWKTNVKSQRGRRRLDFCPQHSSEPTS